MEYASERAQRNAHVICDHWFLPITPDASAVNERFGFGVAERQLCPVYVNHDNSVLII
jgi:hypothetical protein